MATTVNDDFDCAWSGFDAALAKINATAAPRASCLTVDFKARDFMAIPQGQARRPVAALLAEFYLRLNSASGGVKRQPRLTQGLASRVVERRSTTMGLAGASPVR